MDSIAIIRILGLVSATLFCINLAHAAEFNVINYGAKADGKTDDSEAFLKAWYDTCNAQTDNPTMVIPRKKLFFVRPITFAGPCKAARVAFSLRGGIFAPRGPVEWKKFNDTEKLIEFESVTGLDIDGQGLIDAHGQGWWDISCRYHPKLQGCGKGAPTTLRFHHSNDISMKQITIRNSPQTHVLLLGCNDINFGYLNLQSPDGSPNTDGIHIQATNNVSIHNSVIGVGDDCVSIGDGISKVNISYVTCGPGHGISIGSLGKGGVVVNVSDIYVSHVNFKGTQNGARIKTYQTGRGQVQNVEFSNINFTDVGNPIIIDQYYCGVRNGCPATKVGTHINDVRYSEIYGTSTAEVAVNFNCSGNVACTNIKLENIKLTSANRGNQVGASCNNAFGVAKGTMEPKSCLK